jgi:hypothetical protein
VSRTLLACMASLLAGAVAVGAETPLANLPGADFKPGQLRLPLVVTERSGVARRGGVVTSGVPFPPGFLTDLGKLAVVDQAGRPVVSQATLMVKWHKPVYDDSAQWVLVSFAADVPANGTSTYYLTDSGAFTPPASPLKASRGDGRVTIDTGAATFVVPLAGDALIASASIGGKPVIGGAGLQGVITSGDWPERGLKTGDQEVATHEADGVTVEESGPARVVVCIKGAYKPGDRQGRFYQFTARLYFEAGSPAVRVIYSVDNTRIDATLVDGWRRLYTWPIEEAALTADLVVGESTKVTTLAEDQSVAAPSLTVYQDSSGGDKWKDLGGGNYEGWISRYTRGQTVRGVTFRGYKVTEGQNQVAGGNAHLGVMDVSGGDVGLTAALRNFRLEHPHSLVGSSRHLKIGLFPGEFSEPFHLNNGQRKSWDVRLTLHGPSAVDLQQAFAVQDALLLFRPLPAWMVRAGAAGAFPYGIALAPPPNRPPVLRRDASKLDGIHTGWDWYGWISGWNSGGGHWNEEPVLMPWVLWGDGANFDDAESRTLWSADLTALNFDRPDLPALWLWLMSWNDQEPRIRRERYPGWYERDTWGLPDSGHMGMLMWPEYYFLTGDMRAREAIEHLGHRARAFLWQYNYDDRNDGAGPMPRAVNWCKKRDPDADPAFRLATRYVGWPLFDLANAYRLSGDPQILAECRTVARAFRNTARYSPIGFMVLQINAKGDREVYGGQGPFEKYRDLSASQCYAHFQQGLMCTGLIEYYLMSRDDEALDALVGFADLMCHHSLLRDPSGKPQGWTYAFGDYWGPYTWEDAGGKGVTFHVSNYTVTEALGWTTQFTGRRDFAEIVANAVAQPGGGFNEAAALQAVRHPKVDQAPPSAVVDLRAESLGGSQVRLSWTAPGAARYRVKYSTAPIVELVKGWPDRTPPLPANKAEWEAKAAAFNARQRAFWAAQTALNPPAPQPAGAIETMTLTDLAPGAYHFALKSFDENDNLSALSNVVSVEVR